MSDNLVRVLLVEDDEVDVMGVRRAFKRSKIANPIVVAENGLEALEKLRDGSSIPRPFLILLDLNMPRMDGHEFLTELRQDENLKDSIVFILTTSKAEEDKFKAYRHNVAGYLVKENLGEQFKDAVNLLHAYWQVVVFP